MIEPLPTAPSPAGVLPDRAIARLIAQGAIAADAAFAPDQVQPASLDLRLGRVAYRLRASFLPGPAPVADRLTPDLVMHEIDLTRGAVLETGCVYLAPLMERFALPADIACAANPKSSTGRIDVFTRLICDGASAFDAAPAGYCGPLYAEICPRTFSILARVGDRLNQARFRRGPIDPIREASFSIDLDRPGPVGYRARRHVGVLDLARVNGHDPTRYWEPLHAENRRIVLDPGEFYILASRENVTIGGLEAAEMAPIAPELGEFRAHYAGFFDPGFGLIAPGARAVLEVRSRDVPFILDHGQVVGKLVFEALSERPDRLYGENGSHYQGQGLKLSKHFQSWPALAGC